MGSDPGRNDNTMMTGTPMMQSGVTDTNNSYPKMNTMVFDSKVKQNNSNSTNGNNSNQFDGKQIPHFDNTINTTDSSDTNIRIKEKYVELIELDGKRVSKTSKGKRKFHSKSKTGCLNCKRRRVKCDEGKPTCKKCNNLKLECVYAPVVPSIKATTEDTTTAANNNDTTDNSPRTPNDPNVKVDTPSSGKSLGSPVDSGTIHKRVPKKKVKTVVKYITRKADGTIEVSDKFEDENDNSSTSNKKAHKRPHLQGVPIPPVNNQPIHLNNNSSYSQIPKMVKTEPKNNEEILKILNTINPPVPDTSNNLANLIQNRMGSSIPIDINNNNTVMQGITTLQSLMAKSGSNFSEGNPNIINNNTINNNNKSDSNINNNNNPSNSVSNNATAPGDNNFSSNNNQLHPLLAAAATFLSKNSNNNLMNMINGVANNTNKATNSLTNNFTANLVSNLLSNPTGLQQLQQMTTNMNNMGKENNVNLNVESHKNFNDQYNVPQNNLHSAVETANPYGMHFVNENNNNNPNNITGPNLPGIASSLLANMQNFVGNHNSTNNNIGNNNVVNATVNNNNNSDNTKQQLQYHLSQQLQLQQHQQIQLQQNQQYHVQQQQQLQNQQQQFLQQLLEQDLTQQTQSTVDQSVLLSSQLQQQQAQMQLSMSPLPFNDENLNQLSRLTQQQLSQTPDLNSSNFNQDTTSGNNNNNNSHGINNNDNIQINNNKINNNGLKSGLNRTQSNGFPTAGIGGIVYDFQELLGIKLNNNQSVDDRRASKITNAQEALATMQEETERSSRKENSNNDNNSNKGSGGSDNDNDNNGTRLLDGDTNDASNALERSVISPMLQHEVPTATSLLSQMTGTTLASALSPPAILGTRNSREDTTNKEKNHKPKKEKKKVTGIAKLLELSTKANLNLVDMKLFHHYCTTVCYTVSSAQVSVTEVWSKAVPELAFEYPFLMHSLLAFSATHLSRTLPGLEQYVSSHRLDALRLLREAVLEISEENTDALVASALILIMDSLANATSGSPGSSVQSSSAWIFHVKGAATILTAVWPLSENSIFYDLISVDLSDLGDVINKENGTVSELICFDDSISDLYPVDINSPYLITLAYLDKLHREINNSNLILRIFAFPALLDKTFLALLMTGDTNAMRIMRAYYKLLTNFTTRVKDEVWFLEGISQVLPDDVDEYSGGGGMHMMLDFLGGGLPSMNLTNLSDFM